MHEVKAKPVPTEQKPRMRPVRGGWIVRNPENTLCVGATLQADAYRGYHHEARKGVK